jgi:hypothetical protein
MLRRFLHVSLWHSSLIPYGITGIGPVFPIGKSGGFDQQIK